MKIILKGEPKSTQHVYKMTCMGRFARMYMSKEGQNLKLSYSLQAKNQWKEKIHTGNIGVWINFFFGTKRKCDIDNFNKLILDSLTGIVWEDDSQIYALNLQKFYEKKNPRVEIIVEPI